MISWHINRYMRMASRVPSNPVEAFSSPDVSSTIVGENNSHVLFWFYLLLFVVFQVWPSSHTNFKQLLDVRLEQLLKQSALARSYFLLIILHANSHAVSEVAIIPAPPPCFVRGTASTYVAAHTGHLQVCSMCGGAALLQLKEEQSISPANLVCWRTSVAFEAPAVRRCEEVCIVSDLAL